jgi:sporulation protein YlmC with PRC-barrel domain
MVYLSQLLGKTVYYQHKPFGRLADMAIFTNSESPHIAKFEIKKGKKKITVSPSAILFDKSSFTLTTQQVPLLPYDHNDFYLNEDLLDKQVIDIDGRRLVRVNDVVLEQNGQLKVVGIDVGFPGILRRLGLPTVFKNSKIIPWQYIEAFDYQTGSVKIKLSQNKLNTLHPSELADILEDVGNKERVGIVTALDANQAARAIEEANNETQISILEEVPVSHFKDVLNKMHASELADILNYLNPLRSREIENALTEEKAQRVKRLLAFADNVAGGLMRTSYTIIPGEKTVKEVTKYLLQQENVPETVVIVGDNKKLIGTLNTRELLILDPLAKMKDIVKDKKFAYTFMHIEDIFDLFTEYNLRSLPVVDKEKNPVGLIVIDDLLRAVEEEEQ